jgi:preprotein translocase subunit SecD
VINRIFYTSALVGTMLSMANIANAAERYRLRVVDVKPSPFAVQVPYWQFKLTSESRAALARLTEENIDRETIFRIDGKEIARPRIREPIRGETFHLTGAEFDHLTA